MKLIKGIAAIAAATALTFALTGCASPSSSSDDTSSSSSAETSSAESSSSSSSSEESTGGIKEPPIPCPKKVDYKNLSVMVPENWEASPSSINNFISFSDGKESLDGYLEIADPSYISIKSDKELEDFVKDSFKNASQNDITVDDNYTIKKKDNLTYVIVSYDQKYKAEDKKKSDKWHGYSLCGYNEDETIVFTLAAPSKDTKIQETFEWIMENLQVS